MVVDSLGASHSVHLSRDIDLCRYEETVGWAGMGQKINRPLRMQYIASWNAAAAPVNRQPDRLGYRPFAV
jgi:hypothetical protein